MVQEAQNTPFKDMGERHQEQPEKSFRDDKRRNRQTEQTGPNQTEQKQTARKWWKKKTEIITLYYKFYYGNRPCL